MSRQVSLVGSRRSRQDRQRDNDQSTRSGDRETHAARSTRRASHTSPPHDTINKRPRAVHGASWRDMSFARAIRQCGGFLNSFQKCAKHSFPGAGAPRHRDSRLTFRGPQLLDTSTPPHRLSLHLACRFTSPHARCPSPPLRACPRRPMSALGPKLASPRDASRRVCIARQVACPP